MFFSPDETLPEESSVFRRSGPDRLTSDLLLRDQHTTDDVTLQNDDATRLSTSRRRTRDGIRRRLDDMNEQFDAIRQMSDNMDHEFKNTKLVRGNILDLSSRPWSKNFL